MDHITTLLLLVLSVYSLDIHHVHIHINYQFIVHALKLEELTQFIASKDQFISILL